MNYHPPGGPPAPPRLRRALSAHELIALTEVRGRVTLAVAHARRHGIAQSVVLSMVATAFEEAEALERGARLAAASGAPTGGGRRGPRRGGGR